MANTNDGKIILIDTWSSDISLFTVPITVRKIRLWSATAGEKLFIEDANGKQVALLIQETDAKNVTELDFGEEGFRFNGLQIDVSDCTGLAANDLAWIYLA